VLSPKDRLIIALDMDTREKAEEWVQRLKMHVGMFKVGLQLFTKDGPELTRWIRKRGGRIFLDLKFHDIPNTAAGACASACSLGVDLVNVHALGGKAMIMAAAESLKAASAKLRMPKPKLLAVTILTSHDARSLKQEVGLSGAPEKEVLRLARMAKKAGADGVVCSPWEIERVRKACGKDFLIVTPGIRAQADEKGDQKRTLSAADAVARGADYIVVGRPILQSADPIETAKQMVREMSVGLSLGLKGKPKANKRSF
jgi:orotidine-5'-phosphate decarboxylase